MASSSDADVTMPIVCGIVLREAAIASAAWRAREHEPEDGSQQAKAKDHANAGAKPNGHQASQAQIDVATVSASLGNIAVPASIAAQKAG
jgi:hypothetical protein